MKTIEIEGLTLLSYSDLGGGNQAMQVMQKGNYAYVGRSADGLPVLILDISDPRNPRVVGKLPCYPNTRHSKVQTYGDMMIVNYEQPRGVTPDGRTGWAVYDTSDPLNPKELSYVNTGGLGVHRTWWAGERFCYVAGRPAGFRERMIEIYDIADATHPQLAGRWWAPGLWAGGGEPEPDKSKPNALIHHGIHLDGRLYCGYWDAGLLILDVSKPQQPSVVSHLEWEKGTGGKTHTILPLPGRKLLATTDESGQAGKPQTPKFFRVVDASDETAPREVSRWRPDPAIFETRGGRVGPHNLHENRPDTYVSETIVFGTFCNAGLQVLDISDAANPRSIAHYIPDAPPGQEVCEGDDVLVTKEGLILFTDRFGGVHFLEMK